MEVLDMQERIKNAYEHDSKVDFFKVLDSTENLLWYEWECLINYARSICPKWVMEWSFME